MELNCGKCKVRSWHPHDVEFVVRHANNRKIWLNLRDRFPHPYTRTDAENWINGALSVRPETSFAIDISGEAVGGMGFEIKTDVERHSAEVGYWMGEDFWGQGICTEALKTITPYAIETWRGGYLFPRLKEKPGHYCPGSSQSSFKWSFLFDCRNECLCESYGSIFHAEYFFESGANARGDD